MDASWTCEDAYWNPNRVRRPTVMANQEPEQAGGVFVDKHPRRGTYAPI